MRYSKTYVIAIFLACLLVPCSTQAQFGKLKSLAQKVTGAQPSAGSAIKGPSHEALATYAPGVKKTVVVKRKTSGTPEAPTVTGGHTSAKSGHPQTLAIKVEHVDARQFDAVRGDGSCKKVSDFVILSASQLKVTVDLTASKPGSDCSLSFRVGEDVIYFTAVAIN